jgi:TatD DNase family protein
MQNHVLQKSSSIHSVSDNSRITSSPHYTTLGGTAGMVTSYLKIPKIGKRFYFGFSHCINIAYGSHKTVSVIQAIPEDRLLIESDYNSATFMDEEIVKMCKVIASARGWTEEEVAQKTYANAMDAFQLAETD